MSRRPVGTPARLPFSKEEVMDELREVLMGNACQIALSMGRDELAEAYLGISLEDQSFGSGHRLSLEELRKIDLDRFSIARQVGWAFDYAFQIGEPSARLMFDEDDWNDIGIFRNGAARISYGGEPTPLDRENSHLSHTLDMTLARMALDHSSWMNIRDLALLANMGEAAVRTSLSAEGIRTEGKPAQLSGEVAAEWLSRRRGFVPTLARPERGQAPSPTSSDLLSTKPFSEALTAMMVEASIDVTTLAEAAKVDASWLSALVAGQSAACVIDALQRVAAALDADVPLFVGRAVEASLRSEAQDQSVGAYQRSPPG
jgi:hypothetical protein